MKQVYSSILSLLIFCSAGYACQFLPFAPYKFIDSEFVFLGEVIGHTEPVDFIVNKDLSPRIRLDDSFLKSSGLIVKVTDEVFLPEKETTFEIFRYELGSMCEALGVEKLKMQEFAPVGSKVMVVARKAIKVPERSGSGRMRLEVPFSGIISIVHTLDLTSNSIYDFRVPFKNHNERWYYHHGRMTFEIRKELYRLEHSPQNKKAEILDRIHSIPHRFLMVDLYEVAMRHSVSKKKAENRFMKKLRKEGFSEKQIRDYMECKRTENKESWRLYSGSTCNLPRQG